MSKVDYQNKVLPNLITSTSFLESDYIIYLIILFIKRDSAH